MTKYHYTESGLSHVFINGLLPMIDDDGDEVIEIPYVAALHAEIARGIVMSKGSIGGDELRFLRTDMGMTQAELAAKVSVDHQTIGRWERGEYPVEANAELVIRSIAGERLVDAFDESMDRLVERVRSEENDDEINIEAESEGYRLVA